jgi:hypothetical protein
MTWVALLVGLAVLAEGARTLLVFRTHRGAQVRRHLGLALLFIGVSVVLRAPGLVRLIDQAAGVASLAALLRSIAAMASTVGVLGLLRLIGAVRVRLRHVGVVVGLGAACMLWLTLASADREPSVPASASAPGYVVISGVFTAGVLVVYIARMLRVVPTAAQPVRTGICLTLVGFAINAAGVLLALAGIAFPRAGLQAGGWAPLLGQCAGALLVAAGSCYAEVTRQFSRLRERRRCSANKAVINRLWLYIAPLRRRMVPRPAAAGDTQRQIIDIFDALVLARRATGTRVSARAHLTVEAMGLPAERALRFRQAVELRASVEQREEHSEVAAEDRPDVDLAPEPDAIDVGLGAQCRDLADLGRLVFREPSVRRIVAVGSSFAVVGGDVGAHNSE